MSNAPTLHAKPPAAVAAGYVLQAMPRPIDPALLARLARVETATIGHFRQNGFMDSALRPLLPDRRVAGTAVTLSIPFPDFTLLDHAIGLMRRGDLLVIDQGGDTRHASWGGVLSLVAKRLGLAGIVVDGTVTDVPEVRLHGVPVWCRGVSAVTTQRLGIGGAFNVTVNCGGVTVHPGDAIVADENGILVLRADEVEATADLAITFQEQETALIAQLQAGGELGELTGATTVVQAKLATAVAPTSTGR